MRVESAHRREGYRALPDLGDDAVSKAYILYVANRDEVRASMDTDERFRRV
jgi:hypothetical protein